MQEEIARQILGWKAGNPAWTGNYDFFQSATVYDGELSQYQLYNPLDLPPILTAEEVVDSVFFSPVLLERLCEADWLVPLAESPEVPCFATNMVCMALARLRRGEKPPRSSSEGEPVAGAPEIGPKEKYITPQQAADFLSISTSTLRAFADRGEIPSYHLPKSTHRRYKLSDLEVAMQQGRIESFANQVADLKDLLR